MTIPPFLLTMNILVEDLPPPNNSKKQPKVVVCVRSENQVQKTNVVKLEGSSQTWVDPLRLSNMNADSTVSISLYYRRWGQEEIISSVERPLQLFRNHNGVH
ncbi:hypothetical protein NEOLEDRAFT_1133672 [Neolentinus lepideus HHB14362 ss-1]|uniref:C2 domain-containing protein n=1 Tax=Neolentinus lepideus HHB14362 ss-1 TaxID=1314782 RepID=A0A165SKM0_9AGAM|nr:hypothetical protein NEOLEDRAFT_1133672 [Neolentinus lepideus HHB14362 ss-1]